MFQTITTLLLLISTLAYQTVNGDEQATSTPKSKVMVDVYYETLCPDSIDFLLSKLIPSFSDLKEKMTLQLIPFGKAQFIESSSSYEFYCQHGPKECRGNMIQCCVLDLVQYESSLPFIKCMSQDLYGLRKPNVDSVAEKCANQTNLEWEKIDECLKKKGKLLLLEAGKKTKALKPKLSFVPTIVINEKYNDQDQREAFRGEFQQLVERYYNKTDK